MAKFVMDQPTNGMRTEWLKSMGDIKRFFKIPSTNVIDIKDQSAPLLVNFCSSCGTSRNGEGAFCSQCGKSF